jgi:hypothetical protein
MKLAARNKRLGMEVDVAVIPAINKTTKENLLFL